MDFQKCCIMTVIMDNGPFVDFNFALYRFRVPLYISDYECVNELEPGGR